MGTKETKPAEETGNFTAEERAAMKERAAEVRGSRGRKKKDTEPEVLAKIEEMSEPDKSIAEAIHRIVKEVAPGLTAKTWYGMPAYANADGKVVCFFQAASKFDTRYASFGFNDDATLDDGAMWPVSYAVTKLTKDVEKKIRELVAKSVG